MTGKQFTFWSCILLYIQPINNTQRTQVCIFQYIMYAFFFFFWFIKFLNITSHFISMGNFWGCIIANYNKSKDIVYLFLKFIGTYVVLMVGYNRKLIIILFPATIDYYFFSIFPLSKSINIYILESFQFQSEFSIE